MSENKTNFDKFMDDIVKKENEKSEPQYSDEQNPWLIYRKRYSELPQNRIKYGKVDK